MIGGALGFVDVPGPPALSSSEVAQELARIYRETLAHVEAAFIALTNQQRASNQQAGGTSEGVSQQLVNATQSGNPSNPPQASPRNALMGGLPGGINPLTMSVEQMMALGLTPEQHRSIADQRQQIAELAKKAQTSGDPQMQARLQQSLLQLSQQAGISQEQMQAAAAAQSSLLPGGVPRAELEFAKDQLNQMYRDRDPTQGEPFGQSLTISIVLTRRRIIGLVSHPVLPAEQEQEYTRLIAHAQNAVLQFDKMLTVLIARKWQVSERTSVAVNTVSSLVLAVLTRLVAHHLGYLRVCVCRLRS
jgi:hypothetical protein